MKRQMKTKYTIYFLLLICSLTVVTTGCKSKKEITGTREIRDTKELFSIVLDNSLEYKTFSGRMKVPVPVGKLKIDATVSLKIIKDEKLLISVQMPFTGEVVKLGISEDSLIIIDRINKQYVSESIQNIIKNTGFNFNIYNIQSLFTNQLFLGGKPDITEKDYHLFTIQQSQEQAIIRSKEKHQHIDYSFTIDYTDHIRNTIMSGNDGKATMHWMYDNFSTLGNNQLFPMQMNMNLTNKDSQFSMNFTFSKIDLDNNFEIDFNIPNKYTRITLEQAMLLIKSLQQ